ncbi:MAG: SDR family oxidoreductase [Flavobacteriales bacterium]|jgi:UDP-N-acetylglucosamine 4-epimerase|nr:SDR family oxidoreductase [Flavobacteriales bacterium]
MCPPFDPSAPVLVTGGAGFIGSHLCDALVQAGHRVHGLDDLSTGSEGNIAHLKDEGRFRFVQGDIRSMDDVRAAMAGVGTVLHLAALGSVPRSIADPAATHAVNLTGFLHVLEAARQAGVRRFVYASSSSVYGDSAELPKREDRTGRPLSPYAVTKAANEAYAGVYHRLHGMHIIGLRFFNVFGERQDPEGPYAAAIPRFIRSLLRHEPPTIHGDGLQSRDFTYVGNAVQAVLAAMRNDDPACAGQVFNVACGERTTERHLVELLRTELARIDPAVAQVGVVHVEGRQGDVRDSLADVAKARDMLGFTATTGLHDGLQRAVPWYARHWT